MNKPGLKRVAFAVAAFTAAGLLTACEDGPYGRHHDRLAVSDDGYDVYYDRSYGDVYDGYWGDDNYYYYRPARDRAFVRDDSHHFRRDRGDGYTSVRVHDWRNRK